MTYGQTTENYLRILGRGFISPAPDHPLKDIKTIKYVGV